jgi:AcrR family transcriptional regulator
MPSTGDSSARTTRGRYAKGIAKREQILQVALEVIARHGYRHTSVRELAQAAGLSEAGLLHYFGSKEELFEAVLRARDAADVERVDHGADVVDRLIAIVERNRDVPGLVQLYSTFSAEAGDPQHGAHEYFVERYRRLRGALGEAIRNRQAEGRADPGVDAEKVATLLIAVSDGLQVQSQFSPDLDPAAVLDVLMTLLDART